MSMFITFHLDNLPREKRASLIEELHAIAIADDFGVWFADRYIEGFEQKRTKSNPNLFAFDVADNFKYYNCEDILEPWWFDGNNEKSFEIRIGYIEKVANCCLRYTDHAELYIGTSGIFFEDEFDDYHIQPEKIISVLRHHYGDLNEIEPTLHFTLTSK